MSNKEGKREREKNVCGTKRGARKRKKKRELKPDTQELRPLAKDFLD